MSRVSAVVIAACAVGVLAACSSGSDAAPSPTSAADKAPNVKLAPPISNPLNPGSLVGQPCGLLTKPQLDAFGGKAGSTQDTGGSSKNCSWKFGTNHDVMVTAALDPGATGSGLGDIYAGKQQHTYDKGYFEPTTVAGYPAVFANIGDNRKQGSCALKVGINPHMYLDLNIDAYGTGKKSCTALSNTAAKMIDTLKSGGR